MVTGKKSFKKDFLACPPTVAVSVVYLLWSVDSFYHSDRNKHGWQVNLKHTHQGMSCKIPAEERRHQEPQKKSESGVNLSFLWTLLTFFPPTHSFPLSFSLPSDWFVMLAVTCSVVRGVSLLPAGPLPWQSVNAVTCRARNFNASSLLKVQFTQNILWNIFPCRSLLWGSTNSLSIKKHSALQSLKYVDAHTYGPAAKTSALLWRWD